MSKQTEALKLALEALEETRNALAWFYDSYPQDVTKKGNELLPHVETVLTAIREALAEQPAQQQEQKLEFVSPGGGYVPAIPKPIPLDWKLVPRKATPEMLKAMDECAQEGYDERLYAGMASSVYMAAWDASPVMGTLPEQPAQQQEPVAIDRLYIEALIEGLYQNEDPVSIDAAEEFERLLKTPASPPASKPWVGLTDAEIRDWWRIENGLEDCNMAKLVDFTLAVRAIEAKLREKNA